MNKYTIIKSIVDSFATTYNIYNRKAIFLCASDENCKDIEID